MMDIDFQEIDFNACDVGFGNPGPSYLAGVHRCKPGTGVRLTKYLAYLISPNAHI